MKVLFPGSFDPITKGHFELIKRASNLFDEVVIAVMINSNKNSNLTTEEKINYINISIKEFDNVSVISEEGLTVNACVKYGCKAMLRGVRNSKDAEYESELASVNKLLNPDIETIIMIADDDLSLISSSLLKELVINNVDISKLLPETVSNELQIKLKERLK